MRKPYEIQESFDQWLATHWGESRIEVERLFSDRVATRFLIAWSMFEGVCFGGFMKFKEIENFADKISKDTQFDRERFRDRAYDFHCRYQDAGKYANLVHRSNRNPRMENCLDRRFDELSNCDMMYLLIFTVYRYRNNIFHGNKGVRSWTKFQEQIEWCLETMQHLITMYDVSRQDDKSTRAVG